MTNATHAHSEQSDNTKEIDLSQLTSLIKSYWRVILLTGIVGMLISWGLVMTKVPLYTANALIQVKSGNDSLKGLMGTVGALAANISQSASPSEVQQSLLHSRFILGDVVKELHLNISVTPHYFPLLGKHYASRYQGAGLAPAKWGYSHYAWGGEQVEIAALSVPDALIGKKLTLIKTSATTYQLLNPQGNVLIKGVINQAANNLHDHVFINIKHIVARTGVSFTVVESDPAAVVQSLSSALTIADLNTSGSTNTGILNISLTWPDKYQLPIILNKIISIGSQKNIIQNSKNAAKSLEFINKQVPVVKAQLNQAETTLNHYREKHHIIDMTDEAKMLLTQLNSQEQSLQSMLMQKAVLLQSYTKYHPVILAMDDKIQHLRDSIKDTNAHMQHLPSADQKIMGLLRDVKIKENLYANLLEKTEALSVMKAGTIGDITILDLSTQPKLPKSNKASVKVFLGFILGAIFAIVALLVRRMSMNVLLSANEVEKRIPINVQAVMPYCKRLLQKHQQKKKNILLAKDHKDEPIVEAIRGLRTNLQLALATESKKVISVLGSTPGIGKTLLSTNLALVFADTGKKVVLIDTDMRRGQSKKAFSIKNALGLSDYLSGNCELNTAINHIEDNFDVITSGMNTTKSNDLLLGETFEQMLEKLMSQYDYIILDTPPILALSDAVLVAKHATANVFLIGLGKNNADEIAAAYNRFKSNHIKLYTAVCNYCSRVAIKDAAGSYEYYNYEYK